MGMFPGVNVLSSRVARKFDRNADRRKPPTINSPSDIPHLLAWYKADAIPGPPADAAAITSWLDSSGNSYDLTEYTDATPVPYGTEMPTFRTNQINSKPCVRWVNATKTMRVAVPASSNPVTTFLVCKYSASGSQECQLLNGWSGSNWTGLDAIGFMLYGTVGSQTRHFAANGGSGTFADISSPQSTWMILDTIWRGDDTHTQSRNRAAATATGSASTRSSWSRLVSGRYQNANSNFTGPFDMAEILVYRRELTSTEIAYVRDYLAAKYAITLT